MIFQETETVELKEIVIDEIKKEIVAFANTEGGTLYIGVAADGTVVGVDDPDDSALQVSNMVRDAIKPDLTMFIHYETIQEDGKNIVAVKVQRGTDRPYYIAKKGLRPEGVAVRQGYSSVPASDAAIRRMIKETDGDRFEEMRSLEQALTFSDISGEFKAQNIDFGIQQMKTLKIMSSDGLYTNLGLLLSDQCPYTVKVASFAGTTVNEFKDRHEFSGSLTRQMREIYDYLDQQNRTHSTFTGLLRTDTRDYPEISIRESLLNLLVHRDYSYSASALIRLYADRIEFVSIGGLMPGLETEDIMTGISVCRNQNLANVFFRLHFIEAYGTGIPRIWEAYSEKKCRPSIESTSNTFKITLPIIYTLSMTDKEAAVCDLARENGGVTRNDVEQLLSVSPATASRLLKTMAEKDLLIAVKQGRSSHYDLPK